MDTIPFIELQMSQKFYQPLCLVLGGFWVEVLTDKLCLLFSRVTWIIISLFSFSMSALYSLLVAMLFILFIFQCPQWHFILHMYTHMYNLYTYAILNGMSPSSPLVSELLLFARLPSPYLYCKNCPKRVSYLTSVHGPMALFAPSALQEEAPVQGGACWAESSSHEPSVNAKSRFWLSAHTQASCYAFCHCLPVSLVSLFFFFFVDAMLSCVLVLSKETACNAGDRGLIPGSRRSPGAGNGNPLQYSCLENSMDRGVWQATVLEIAKSWTQLFSVSVSY